MSQKDLYDYYNYVMRNEMILEHKEAAWGPIMSADEAYNTAWQIKQTMLLSFEKRSYYEAYHISGYAEFFESVGGHTNLVRDLIGKYWRFLYGPETLVNSEQYSYMELEEAAGKHDLAEVILHDIADNGNRDENSKSVTEQRYRRQYAKYSPKRDCDFEQKVTTLLELMDAKKSESGRALYAADKSSAVLITLCCNELGLFPYRTIQEDNLSERDREEIAIINDGYDVNPAKRFLASEMWSVDYFVSRKIIQYDDTGFFTAIIVMYTLMVTGRWYNWREKDYKIFTESLNL